MNQHVPHWNMEDNNNRDFGDILAHLDEQEQGDLAALLWQTEQYAALEEQAAAVAALQEQRELLLGGISADLIPQEGGGGGGGGETSSWFDNPFDRCFCTEILSDGPVAGACSAEAAAIPDIKIDSDDDVGAVIAAAGFAGAVNELGSGQIQEHVVANSSLCGGSGAAGGGVTGRGKEVDDGFCSAAALGTTTFAASTSGVGGGEQGECRRGEKRKEIAAAEVVGKQEPLNSHEAKRLAIRIRAAQVHNLSERRRRDKINEKMKTLQDLIPHSNKTDKASLLDETIVYLKSLQLQVQLMWTGSGMRHMMYPGVQLLQYDASRMGMGMAHQYYHHHHHPHQHHAVQLMLQNGAGSSAGGGAASSSQGNLFFHPPAAMKPVDLQSLQMERPPCFGFHHLPPPHPQMMNLCPFGQQMLHQSQLAAAVPASIILPTVPCDKDDHGSKPGETNF